jgi:hypothetical protein
LHKKTLFRTTHADPASNYTTLFLETDYTLAGSSGNEKRGSGPPLFKIAGD